MCSIEDLKIDIKSLVEGESTVAVSLGDDYFVSLESEEIMRGDVHVDVSRYRATAVSTLWTILWMSATASQ